MAKRHSDRDEGGTVPPELIGVGLKAPQQHIPVVKAVKHVNERDRCEECLQKCCPCCSEIYCCVKCWFHMSGRTCFHLKLVIMVALTMVTGLPACLLQGLLCCGRMAWTKYCGTDEGWNMFVTGKSDPDEVSEACNRNIAGKTEARRGKGPCHNLLYHIRNNHPFFGIFCCEYGHPFSPFERIGLLLLLNSFAYYMAGVKVNLMSSSSTVSDFNDEQPWLSGQFYNGLCITLPSMVLEHLMKHYGLSDYKYELDRTKYFEEKKTERCQEFAKKFCHDLHLVGKQFASEESPKNNNLNLMDCCNCGVRAFERCLIEHLANMFFSIALTASIVLLVLGVHLDVQDTGEQWLSMLSGLTQNFLLFWFIEESVMFMGRWLYQHWSGPSMTCCKAAIPPLPEHRLELQHFFKMVDKNADGSLSREEISNMVNTFCRSNLSEEGWLGLLKDLDSDMDGKVSAAEMDSVLAHFAVKTGWWTRRPPMDTE